MNTAIGLDEAGINDDRDMLRETKLVLRAHRVPGMVEADVPTVAQMLRTATVGGARTTPFGEGTGSLEVSTAADMVLIDWNKVAWPYLDEMTPTLDAVIQCAKNDAVTMTMCDGEVIYRDGIFTKVDRTAALKALHDDLNRHWRTTRSSGASSRSPYCPMPESSTRTASIPRSTSRSIGGAQWCRSFVIGSGRA